MPIQVYNSLTRKKEEFIPVNSGRVNMYTCGVTVYDECHIGHARSLYIFDVIRRYLEYRGFSVNFVRNITDIDDKIIKRAAELKKDWKELVDKYINSYYQDLQLLGVSKGITDGCDEPRATANIDDILKFIEALEYKGYAYATESGVYFSVRKFKDYGKLSGQSIDQMLSGVRKESDEAKNDPLDFALWKASKPGEPAWDSKWGRGRPGWHIECSLMSTKYLKADTLDIHAGGRDLIFPHHENEIAQSEAVTGKPFAKYWIHHGLLTINSQKMAKSLGNFITIKKALEKYPADVLKVFYLHAHYSSSMDFSDEKMQEAGRAYEGIDILLGKLERAVKGIEPDPSDIDAALFVKPFRDKFLEYMDDDFNTPRALSVVFDLVSAANKLLEEADKGKANTFFFVKEAVKELCGILGLTFEKKQEGVSEEEINALIKKRLDAKKKKDFKQADDIRKELEVKGVILEDTKDGTLWRRKI